MVFRRFLRLVEPNPNVKNTGQHRRSIFLDRGILDYSLPDSILELAEDGTFLGYVNEHSHRDSGTYWWFSNHPLIRSDGPSCATVKLTLREAEKQLKARCVESLVAATLSQNVRKFRLDPKFRPTKRAEFYGNAIFNHVAEESGQVVYDHALAGFFAGIQYGERRRIDLSNIPSWARYVVQCSDGKILLFEYEPKINIAYGKWDCVQGRCFELRLHEHWEYSLQKIK